MGQGNHLMTIAKWPEREPCNGCACRKGTEANRTPETMAEYNDAVQSGEPFWCHESIAVRDEKGTAVDKYGNRYRRLPKSQWKLCAGWTKAINRRGKGR